MIERLKQMYRRSRFMRSMRIRIFLIILIVGSIPCAVIHIGLVSSYDMRAVNQRLSDVRTQMKVLANHLIYYDYLSDPSSESINAELDQFSTLNDGRVLVINAGLKVVKDTYGISEGKTIVTEEIVRCLKYGSDGTVSLYDKNNGYIELTTPIVETASLEAGDYSSKTVEERVRGVLLTSVSTDSIAATSEVLSRRGLLLETIMLLVVFSMALLLSGMLVRPFRRLVRAAGEVRSGFSGSVEPVNSYVETQAIVEAFNRVLARDRVLDESREEFVSNVSHELKTPMTSMKVLADSLLAEDNVPPEMYREFMEDIAKEIDRENKIIGDLLSLVRMDSKAVAMNISSLDINALTEIILRRIRPLAEKRDVELTLVSECPVTAEVDEVKFSLILTNLIENAVKYNREHGKVIVTLDADRQNFTVKVEDTGIGIPEDSLELIYDRFYRVDKSRSREVSGTGLGLSIARNAVLLHRGTIDVTSRPGEGSVFTVSIPLTYIKEPTPAENMRFDASVSRPVKGSARRHAGLQARKNANSSAHTEA